MHLTTPLSLTRHWATNQVTATSALMEAVRCELGVGVFASSSYCQLLTTLVSAASVKPEVRAEGGDGMMLRLRTVFFMLKLMHKSCHVLMQQALTFLFTRYFQYADVRYYTLWAVREVALYRTRPQGAKAAVIVAPRNPTSHAMLQQGGWKGIEGLIRAGQ